MRLVLHVHIVAELWLVVRSIDLRVNLAYWRWHVTRKMLCVAALNWIIIICSARTTVTDLRETRMAVELPSLDVLIWILLLHVATFVVLGCESFLKILASILRNVTWNLSVTNRLRHSRLSRHKAVGWLPAYAMVTRISGRVEIATAVISTWNRGWAHNAMCLLLIYWIILLRSTILLHWKHIWSRVFKVATPGFALLSKLCGPFHLLSLFHSVSLRVRASFISHVCGRVHYLNL